MCMCVCACANGERAFDASFWCLSICHLNQFQVSDNSSYFSSFSSFWVAFMHSAHSINLILVLIQPLKQFISFVFALIEMFIPFWFCSNSHLKIKLSWACWIYVPHCVQRESWSFKCVPIWCSSRRCSTKFECSFTTRYYFHPPHNTNYSFRLEIATRPRCARSFFLNILYWIK